MVEIVTEEWKYFDTEEGNFSNILHVKEQRRLGTSRGTTSTPQAPVLKVRVKADLKGLPEKCSVKAILWSYGPAYVGKNRMERSPPAKPDEGNALTKLRSDTYITCTDNIELLSEPKPDGYRYAEIKCFITRGARVCCRKNHIALRLCIVEEVTQVVSGVKKSVEKTVAHIPPTRTARLSISEKAMCPRESDKKRKGRKRMLHPSTENKNKKSIRSSDSGIDMLKHMTVNAASMYPSLHNQNNLLALKGISKPGLTENLPFMLSQQYSTDQGNCVPFTALQSLLSSYPSYTGNYQANPISAQPNSNFKGPGAASISLLSSVLSSTMPQSQ